MSQGEILTWFTSVSSGLLVVGLPALWRWLVKKRQEDRRVATERANEDREWRLRVETKLDDHTQMIAENTEIGVGAVKRLDAMNGKVAEVAAKQAAEERASLERVAKLANDISYLKGRDDALKLPLGPTEK